MSDPDEQHTRLVLRVNGHDRPVPDSLPGESLLFVLRERLGLPAAKGACEQGECGSCSVLVDGELLCSCLVLADAAAGREVTTVEGLAQGDDLHPMQEAFWEDHGLQCGYCTPGMIMTAVDLVNRKGYALDEHTIRHELEGNLCRCTGYRKILAAVRHAGVNA